MLATYAAVYRDANGEEKTAIQNDGKTLRMAVRGVEFAGPSFDQFKPITSTGDVRQAPFTFERGDLCAYVIECNIGVPVVVNESILRGTLHVYLDLGGPVEGKRIGHEILRLTLKSQQHTVRSYDEDGVFETALLQIQRALPEDVYVKSCFNCAFSGYSPYGGGLWGMFCHRNNKAAYVAATSKAEWLHLDQDAAEVVQETYLCPEFERWNGKSGYRDTLNRT